MFIVANRSPIRKKVLAIWGGLGVVIFLLLLFFFLPFSLFTDSTSTVIEDKDGNLIGAKIADDGQWRFPHNDSIPEKFIRCITQFEDRHFFHHPGINPVSMFRALKQNIRAKKIVSGGSTITMQVIRLSRKGQPRTFLEKFIEIILALKLELTESKSKILSYYVSNAPFGGNVVGLDAASWRYFGREQLSWAETAALAVLPNAPSLIYPGKNHEKLLAKRNRLLNRLYEIGEIDSTTCELSKAEPLPEKPFSLPELAPHLLTRIYLEGKKGERTQTTIDKNLQLQTSQIIERYHKFLKNNHVHNAAALIIEVETGNVIAYIGNTKEDSAKHENDVDIIASPRSTGSIMKPFLFAAMMKDGEILPNTLIPDIPTEIAGYAPKNNDSHYDGAVPAYRALARSLNIPAVRMLQNYGLEKFHHLLQKIGLTTIDKPAEHYGLSIVLGGAESTLWDLCGVYASMSRTLNHFRNYSGKYDANDWREAQFIKSQIPNPKSKIILDAASIYFTYKALIDVSRPENESEWELFSSSKKIAWKTGTSFGNRDAWAIGTTAGYVVGVWVGNATGEGRPGLTGISTAAPIMFEIFNLLPHTDWFEQPFDEMMHIAVCSQSGQRATEHCAPADTIWIHEAGLQSIPCAYHKIIHLDKTEKFRVTSECYNVSEMNHKAWFVLPPIQEWYYKNPDYKKLPPFMEGCSENAMDLIYPKPKTKISVPVNLEGKKSEVIFEAVHRRPQTTIHWHLDNNYEGSTINFHQISLQLSAGSHTITLVDENGETLTRKFLVQ